MPKNVQATAQLHSSDTLAKKCSKFSKLGYNSIWIETFQMFKLDLEKAEETRDQIANIHWIIQKAREFQKNIYFCLIDYVKAFDSVDRNKLWKILLEIGIPDHLTCLLRNLYTGQKQQLEPDVEQQTGYKSGKEYVKAVYCNPDYLTYVQSTSCEMTGWMKHKLQSRFLGKYE